MYGPARAFTTVRTPECVSKSNPRVDIKSCGTKRGAHTSHSLLSANRLCEVQSAISTACGASIGFHQPDFLALNELIYFHISSISQVNSLPTLFLHSGFRQSQPKSLPLLEGRVSGKWNGDEGCGTEIEYPPGLSVCPTLRLGSPSFWMHRC